MSLYFQNRTNPVATIHTIPLLHCRQNTAKANSSWQLISAENNPSQEVSDIVQHSLWHCYHIIERMPRKKAFSLKMNLYHRSVSPLSTKNTARIRNFTAVKQKQHHSVKGSVDGVNSYNFMATNKTNSAVLFSCAHKQFFCVSGVFSDW